MTGLDLRVKALQEADSQSPEAAIISRPGHSAWCVTAKHITRALGVEPIPLDGGVEALAALGDDASIAFLDVPAMAEAAGFDVCLEQTNEQSEQRSISIWRLKQTATRPEALVKARPLAPPGYAITGEYLLGGLRVHVAERMAQGEGAA